MCSRSNPQPVTVAIGTLMIAGQFQPFVYSGTPLTFNITKTATTGGIQLRTQNNGGIPVFMHFNDTKLTNGVLSTGTNLANTEVVVTGSIICTSSAGGSISNVTFANPFVSFYRGSNSLFPSESISFFVCFIDVHVCEWFAHSLRWCYFLGWCQRAIE